MLNRFKLKSGIRGREFSIQHFIVLFLLLVPLSPLKSQWYNLWQFDFPVGLINFQHSEGKPMVGFVGSSFIAGQPSDITGKLYKTTDGGISWTKVSGDNWLPGVTDISFKDDNVGWAVCGFVGANPNQIQGSCYKTTDAGQMWTQLINVSGFCTSVQYLKLIDGLIIGRWGDDILLSKDGGNTFSAIPGTYVSNGSVMWNDYIGMLGCVTKTGLANHPFIRTIDGGLTWTLTTFYEEAWQPLAVKNTSTGFVLSEANRQLYRTDDYGLSWYKVFQFDNILGVQGILSGHIAGDMNNLIVQSEIGFFTSTDQGNSWKYICGPKTKYDTRFFSDGNIIYGGEIENSGRLWVNTSGTGSGERILIEYQDGSRDQTVRAGDEVTVAMRLPQSLATIPWIVLDSVTVTLAYNEELLSVIRADAYDGWTVSSLVEEDGKARVLLVRQSGADRGVPLGSVRFRANIGRDTATDITVTDVLYNAGMFTNCETVASEQLHLSIDDQCGDEMIRQFLKQNAVLKIISIHPNPATDEITIEYEAAISGEVTMQMTEDASGILVQTRQLQASKGRNSITENLQGLIGSGAYTVTLRLGNDAATARFVKQ